MTARRRRDRAAGFGALTGLLAVVLTVALGNVGSTFALWTSKAPLAPAAAATIRSANPALGVTGFGTVGGTFDRPGVTKTAPFTIRNSGDVALRSVSVSPVLRSGSQNVSDKYSVVRWGPVSSGAECTENAQPAAYTPGPFAYTLNFAAPDLAPGASAVYCLRVRLDTEVSGSVSYQLTATGSVASSNWKASATTSAVSFTSASGDTIAPSTPAAPSATPAARSVALTWPAATDNRAVTAYEVYRAGVLLTTVNGTSFSDTNLNPNTQYLYSLRAVDAAGNRSAMSPTTTTRTLAASTSPTGTYRLTTFSGLCVDAAQFIEGASLMQNTCGRTADGGSRLDVWNISPGTGATTSKILSLDRNSYGWEVPADPASIRTQITTYTSANNQQWQVQQVSGDTYRFVSATTGKCLDIPNARSDVGLELQQFTCNDTQAQTFRLVPVS